VFVLSLIATIVYVLLLIYSFIMWGRLALDVARTFLPRWRPAGAGLVIAEFVFSATDPPIKAVRKLVPPIRIGGIALDLAWSIVMLAIIILIYVVQVIRAFV
jgi:YggT family protein